jgi:Holliday junction resolvase RusA-like endonuclease
MLFSSSIADRQSALEAELKIVQTSRRDLENFLKWLQEAETTANVLADASQREDALQDSTLAQELKQQMQVRAWEATPAGGVSCALWLHLQSYYC